jgi:hypothetical protein
MRSAWTPAVAGGRIDRTMIYKFKSRATGDLVMLGEHGDLLLRLIGREPAPRGIIEPVAMPGVIAALEDAIAAAERGRDPALPPADRADAHDDEREEDPARHLGLRQRAWPMIEMLRRAQAEDAAITWGV